MVLLNALLETFSCVYSETMLTIISFFQKLIKGGGVGIRAGGLENVSKVNKRGEDYSVFESNRFELRCQLKYPGYQSSFLLFFLFFEALVPRVQLKQQLLLYCKICPFSLVNSIVRKSCW